ncbi:hypothetical protein G6F46_005762 [Rhizopus delemar]|nr:hypothetical protein G6F43_006374 [Rhizopus delemar]KAG1544812.1 hypothetical protein G6F51_005833 [Rhizopus arrhizus]KAG1452846.1 hypothetical protein G6F55_008451 [Rhizopus delemar]KAG1498445.1 hypothetical protein G6F54_005077 [Rhizopus delemar]KAG1512213.1 hypothetical protein G6F53_005351 [Rhizopus delemar]
MSVELDVENTIYFERPVTRIVKKNVQIKNPHSKPVAFKVKTTAPKLYCVRPNSEIIPPNGMMTVQIMLQAYREEPPADFKCKDKFLIVSVLIEGELESLSLGDIWNRVETKEKGAIHQQKLRVEYVYPNQEPQQIVPVKEDDNNAKSLLNGEKEGDSNNNTNKADEVEAKMKKMEEELQRYKNEVENLRNAEPTVVVERVQKTTESPVSMIILFTMLALAIAYFVQQQKV